MLHSMSLLITYFMDLLNPGIEPGSLILQADSLPSELPVKFSLVQSLGDFKILIFPNSS